MYGGALQIHHSMYITGAPGCRCVYRSLATRWQDWTSSRECRRLGTVLLLQFRGPG